MSLTDPAQRVIEHPASAPQQLTVQIAANLTGVAVRISRQPSQRDPLGQLGGFEFHFPDLDQALTELPGICRCAIADIAASNAPSATVRHRD